MRYPAFCVFFLLFACLGRAIAGRMTPAPVTPDEARFARPFVLMTSQFSAAPHGCGTIAKNARVAALGNAGAIRVALDADQATAKQFTCLRFDFSGSGKFTKQFTARLSTRQGAGGNQLSTIVPHTFSVPIHGRITPVTVSGIYQPLPKGCLVYLYLATALQGVCRFAGKSHPVRLVFGSGSLGCGNSWPLIAARKGFDRIGAFGDMLIVDPGAGKKPRYGYYGHPMQVDGAWYTLKLSADGATLNASPFTGPKGAITFDYSHWDASLLGKRYYFDLTGTSNTAIVPADSYTILDFHGYPAGSGNASTCCIQLADIAGTGKEIIVPARGKIHANVGAGILAHINVVQNQRNLTFLLVMTDPLGNPLSAVTLANGAAGAEKIPFEVVDAQGQSCYHGDFAHAGGGYTPCSWQAPETIHGTLTARITELKLPPFKVTLNATQFAVN